MILGRGPAPDAARQALLPDFAAYRSSTVQASIPARMWRQRQRIELALQGLYLDFTQQSDAIEPAHLAAMTVCLVRFRTDARAWLRSATIVNPQEALALALFQPFRAQFAELLAQCSAADIGLQLTRMAAKQGECRLPNPFAPGQASCRQSLFNKGLNALRFEAGGQSFFLLQNISSADSLYFPLHNLLIYLAHARSADARLLYAAELDNLLHRQQHQRANPRPQPQQWAGLIASHARPAHFYYEVLPTLHALIQDESLAAQVPCVRSCQDHDFYDLGQLYPQLPWQAVPSQTLIDATYTGQWWIHLSGNPHQRHGQGDDDDLNTQLLAHALAHPSAQAPTHWAEVQGCTPLVWVGLEGQKRCWLEQVEGLAYVLAQLAQQFPQLGVVVDGWTLPLTPSERSLAEAAKDMALARQLLAELAQRAPSVRHTVLVGASSQTKLYLASRVDFFISNFASGSLHVSRLARKPGFCHLSRALVQHSLHEHVQQHPHRQVYLLPQRWVQDVPERAPSWQQTLLRLWQRWRGVAAAAPEAGAISYSIRPQDFWAFIQPRLHAVLAPAPARVQLFLEPSFAIHPEVRRPIHQACHGRMALVFPTLAAAPKLAALAHWPVERLQNTLVYGLFAFGDEAALGLPCDWLLWLSEPLRRTQLHAQQFVQNAHQAGQNLSLEEVLLAQHKALDNYYTRLLSGQDAPFGDCTPAMLAQALLNLRENVRFIGLDEDQAGSFARLCAHMDWDADLFPQQLPERLAPPPEAAAPALQAHWPALVALDVQLYAAVRQWLQPAPS